VACIIGNIDIIKVLCDHGAKPEMKGTESALEIAISKKNITMLRLLYYAYYQQRKLSFEMIQKVC
jgi:hypothetical protein